jgi:hypothetical protein
MTDDRRNAGFSLRRWSQRKLEAKRAEESALRPGNRQDTGPEGTSAHPRADPTPPMAADAPANPRAASETAPVPSLGAGHPPPTTAAPRESGQPGTLSADAALPPIDSLTIESDFTPFMRSGVDADVKRGALKKLFRDSRFNVMDGLDVYIDDYSKPSPIEPEVVRTLMQARYIFDPPRTRVNDQGVVEDIPREATTADATAPDALDAETPAAAAPSNIAEKLAAEQPAAEGPVPAPDAGGHAGER